MKNMLSILLALCLLLCGCQTAAPEQTEQTAAYDWMAGECPIPQQRTGITAQGVTSGSNGFECTEDGVYFMRSTSKGNFLFYGDHGSDLIVKLCGRPDCTHADADCNAYFENGISVCYYNGSLYAVQSVAGAAPNVEVVKFRPDGTGRVSVVDTLSISEGYSGNACARLWNGIFTIVMTRVDASGNEVGDAYYFKLDGSMEHLERASMMLPYRNDGENFLVYGVAEDGSHDFFRWDPDTNENTPVLSGVEELNTGYIGAEWSYKIEDGIVSRYNNVSEERLFDTGLDGEKALLCFPDCIVIRDHVSWNAHLAGEELREFNLYFYNWDFEFLGSVELDYPRDASDVYLICGETPERIILTDGFKLYPRYYIEKSDFGTGNIEIHEYNLPDLTEELALIDEQLADEEWLDGN